MQINGYRIDSNDLNQLALGLHPICKRPRVRIAVEPVVFVLFRCHCGRVVVGKVEELCRTTEEPFFFWT
jgi:hypothetical protein